MSEPAIQTLLRRLDLERLDRDLFRGYTPNDGRPRVFGGLVAAQALVAAARTVPPDIRPHSLHSYFLRPGDPTRPIIYEVDRIRDGKSFLTRRVVGIQEGEAIYSAGVSFHKEEDGLSHQVEMPDAPPPEQFPTNRERLAELAERSGHPVFKFLLTVESPIEHRDPEFIDPLSPRPHRGLKRLWFKPDGPMPPEPIVHAAVMTYATDMGLLDNCIQWHGLTWLAPKLQVASLDHAIWFHRRVRSDEWHLHDFVSRGYLSSRGLAVGNILTESGVHVATVTQEVLLRRV